MMLIIQELVFILQIVLNIFLNQVYFIKEKVSYIGADDSETLKVVLAIYKKMKQFPDALRIAIKMNDQKLMKAVLEDCQDA